VNLLKLDIKKTGTDCDHNLDCLTNHFPVEYNKMQVHLHL
jgi:hypothetical protein